MKPDEIIKNIDHIFSYVCELNNKTCDTCNFCMIDGSCKLSTLITETRKMIIKCDECGSSENIIITKNGNFCISCHYKYL